MLTVDECDRFPKPASATGEDDLREWRLQRLIRLLPLRVQNIVGGLRQPSARWLRMPAGVLLIGGSFLSILPVFGVWMMPLGLLLLAEDVPPLRRSTGRILAWIEDRRPHWMGLPRKS